MIDYRECMVRMGDKSSAYVWVAYQKEAPYLPVAVRDSAQELAQAVGVPRGTVESNFSKYRHGKSQRARYMCVYIGGV